MANGFKKMVGAKWFQRTSAVALGLVLLAVVVSIVLAFVAPADKTPTAQDPTSTAPTQDAAEPAASDTATTGEKCNVPAGDMSFEPKMPADLKWEASKGLSWPVSGSVGPTRTSGEHPTCWAKSPLGVALFTTAFINQMWTNQDVDDLADFYVSDSPDKTHLLASLKGAKGGEGAAEMVSKGMSNVGFVVDRFTGNEASVSVVLTTPGRATPFLAFRFHSVWDGNDWKITKLRGGPMPEEDLWAPTGNGFVRWTA